MSGHRPLRKFSTSGEIADEKYIPSSRQNYERLLIQAMRDQGYIPVLDINTAWSTSYNMQLDKFEFQLSIHGVYAGTKKAWEYEGVIDGKFISR